MGFLMEFEVCVVHSGLISWLIQGSVRSFGFRA